MKKKRLTKIDKTIYLTGLILAIACALFLISNRLFGQWFHLSPCLFHTLTGYYCPGCGGTRAVIAFFHGRFIQSFFYHPVVPLFFIGYLIYMITNSIHLISKGHTPLLHAHARYLWILLIVTIANWIIKNLFLLVGHISLL
ncbi:DUF2752 domain-containing protein [Eubacterium oxidoreducens]|uniref:DUF2752 domain-containing protein n=1 Tax=Eubacterium oxidoreducens TaxID=1732 RepID=UPI0015A4DD32